MYVLSDYGKFIGVLSLRTLVLTPEDTVVSAIMYTENLISVTPDEEEEEVAADIFKYDMPAIPVCDESGVLLGIVTTEDAWDAIEDDVSGDRKIRPAVLAGIIVGAVVILALYTIVVINIVQGGMV